MKAILAASPALLLAGAMFAAPASAQTMAHPNMGQPMGSPYAGNPAPQSYTDQGATQSYAGQAMSNQLTATGPLPQGPYLSECKDVRMLQDTHHPNAIDYSQPGYFGLRALDCAAG